MGVYDYILGHTRCGYCNCVHAIDEQIKFPMDRNLNTYIIGDEIDVVDGEYDYLSGCRNPEYTCKICGNHNKYSVVVKDGILVEFKTVKQSEEVFKQTHKRLREEARIRQELWFNDIMNIKQNSTEITKENQK